ncbi:MAG: HAD family phosphatase [Spirochaetaceae bacterium]|jgi:putative hydrolase of the HAD superfamily|nr:HAD family phosphatase [Spirochaetaceae bacterium]
MIKAVIFDYGNVISLPQDGSDARAMSALTGIPADFFAAPHQEFRADFDRGIIDGITLYRCLLESRGRHDLAGDPALLTRLAELEGASWDTLNQDVVAWALELRRGGLKLGVLSNMPHEFLARHERDIPVFTAADYACFSCRVGLIKPEPEIYWNCLAGLAVAPEEAVFFDDLPENIAEAQELGIHGILWAGLDAAKLAWKKLLKKT